MSAPLDVVYLIAARSGLTFECSDPHPLQADEQMSQDLSLDSKNSIIRAHAATRLTVQIFLDGLLVFHGCSITMADAFDRQTRSDQSHTLCS